MSVVIFVCCLSKAGLRETAAELLQLNLQVAQDLSRYYTLATNNHYSSVTLPLNFHIWNLILKKNSV